ncbi:MAG TPA: glycosyltransferase family 1 protein, partial [Acidobacteriota bacterium]|nr:glycosyltransferase family 1 protein [Acidobacteriota bacterium]
EMAENHRFFLYCSPGDARTPNGNLIWVPEASSKYSVREHFSLAKKAARDEVTLFHAPHYTLPLALRCKSIVTVHDLIHLQLSHYFPAWKVQAAKLLLRRAIAKADVVLTVSHTSKEEIVQFFPQAEQKVEVIYNCLSEDWLQSPPQTDLSNLGIAQDFILYVGNFKKHKSIDVLLEAYGRLKDAPQLVLAGYRDPMDERLAEKISGASGVRLLGFVEGPLLRRLYSAATLFVFPSIYEGFGYPPLEAMISGAPVLSSDASSLKEILGDAAEFFVKGSSEDLTEKLMRLLQDSGKRAALRQAGIRRAKEFVSTKSAEKLLQIYNRFQP